MMNLVLEKRYFPLIKCLEQYRKNRTLVLWGGSGDLEKYLQGKYELKWASYDPQKISDCVMHMDQLCEKNEKYYIIIPWLEKNDKRVNILKKYGYEPYKDFFFIKHNKIQIITKLGMHYKDEYGNEVISDSDGIEIVFNNSVYNAKVVVGKDIKGKVKIDLRGSCANVVIEAKCQFKSQYIVGAAGSKIRIGENSTFNLNCNFGATEGWTINIGKDCMFSFDVIIQAGDSHALFNGNTKERYNWTGKNNTSSVIIGDHVWIGLRAVILGTSIIRKGSVVGACSLIKGDYKEYSAIAGNPGRVIKNNIAWSRDNASDEIIDCGMIYSDF